MSLLDDARSLMDGAVDLRRRIHRQPEIGLDLPRTQRAILEALEGLPLAVSTGERTTSVVAVLQGEHPGPTLLLRGDMDALPMPEDTGLEFASEVDGAMHACGHDTHVAMLSSAARLLAGRRDLLHGSVLFMFQPGEEGFHGARFMIEEGLLDGPRAPEAAFAIHIISILPSGQITTKGGPLLAASDRPQITVRGRGGHASSPHLSRDPVAVAAEIVTALQTLVTRHVDVFDPAVITITHIQAGSANNVIPESAWMEGTMRTLSIETRERLIADARRLVAGIASAHGLEAELTLDEEGYPATINDTAMADFALRVAVQELGTDAVGAMEVPMMGSEDFSYILQRVPGAMVRLGGAPPGVEAPPSNHSNRVIFDEAAMVNGIALYAGMALHYLDGKRGAPASGSPG